MEQRTEIDTSMFKYINANSGQAQRNRKRELEISGREADERFFKNMNSFYENSIQDSNNTKKQEIRGETYVGKSESLTKKIGIALKITAGILAVAVTVEAGKMAITLDEYNDVLNEKMEQQLTDGEIAYYENVHSNPIKNAFESYTEIKDVEKQLKQTDNYDLLGNNITGNNKEYEYEYTRDDLFPISNLTEDAIDIVTDNVVEESRGHFHYGK